jgi:hypothetical protein
MVFTEDQALPHERIPPSPIVTPIPIPASPQISGAPTDSRQLQWALSKLQNAPLGMRHATRLKIGQLVGGWITGQQLDPIAADILSETAAAHSDNPTAAKRDIVDAMRYGAVRPLPAENTGFNTLVVRARSRRRFFNG